MRRYRWPGAFRFGPAVVASKRRPNTIVRLGVSIIPPPLPFSALPDTRTFLERNGWAILAILVIAAHTYFITGFQRSAYQKAPACVQRFWKALPSARIGADGMLCLPPGIDMLGNPLLPKNRSTSARRCMLNCTTK